MSIDAPPIPPTSPPEEKGFGGGRPGWALLRTVGDLYEAHMVRGVLEENEIGPVVIEPVQVIGSWLLPSGHERTPQRIFVPAAVLDAAELALMEAGLESVDDDEATAGDPTSVEPTIAPPLFGPSRSRKLARWTLLIAFGAAVLVYLLRVLNGTAGVP